VPLSCSPPTDGRIKEVNTAFDFGSMFGKMMGRRKPWIKSLSDAGFEVQEERLEGLFKYLNSA
jgi:hypothetical protein